MNRKNDGSVSKSSTDISQGTKDLYKRLAQEKMDDVKQSQEELRFFLDLYSKEIYGKRDSSKTLEIIKSLEGEIDAGKEEYLRLKAISHGRRQP